MEAVLILLGILAFFLLLGAGSTIRIVQQYEQGIVFRFGRIQMNGVRRAGLTAIVPIADRMQKVNMQTVVLGVPSQDGITQDNVSVRVDAVVYFRVIDPIKAIVNVQNYGFAVSQVAQTTLRSVIGKADMQDLLADRDKINANLRQIIDEITEAPWGIRIERVEIKDVSLPEGMKRSMARQAEAERERRARVIHADGEYQASKRLAAAAHELSKDPASLQLRLLQTVTDVAAEKNSTLIMPLPVEMLRFFDKLAGGPEERAAAAAPAEPIEEPPEIETADDVPPVAALDEPVGAETPAVEAHQDTLVPERAVAGESGRADDEPSGDPSGAVPVAERPVGRPGPERPAPQPATQVAPDDVTEVAEAVRKPPEPQTRPWGRSDGGQGSQSGP